MLLFKTDTQLKSIPDSSFAKKIRLEEVMDADAA